MGLRGEGRKDDLRVICIYYLKIKTVRRGAKGILVEVTMKS